METAGTFRPILYNDGSMRISQDAPIYSVSAMIDYLKNHGISLSDRHPVTLEKLDDE